MKQSIHYLNYLRVTVLEKIVLQQVSANIWYRVNILLIFILIRIMFKKIAFDKGMIIPAAMFPEWLADVSKPQSYPRKVKISSALDC